MSKFSDQLQRDDTPWYQFVSAIDDLLVTGQYDWAFDALQALRETVEQTRRVTTGQQRAIADIARRQHGRWP